MTRNRANGGGEAFYRASPTKRFRRTKAAVRDLCEAIYNIVSEEWPMTVRQVFYRLVSAALIEKTDNEYNNVACRLLLQMRKQGELPWDWIADNTRWMRKPKTFKTVEDALRQTAQTYRRALWDEQDVYVEVWCEKDALAGVLLEETGKWDVPLMVTRGFPSESYVYEAAETIKNVGKPAYLYYFGDHDPSGVCIDPNTEKKLRLHAPYAELHFQRVAVTERQIVELSLPTRPTKTTDKRSKHFKGESVEVDAIPSRVLRQLVADCIVRHVDQRALEVTRIAEQSEREHLVKLCGRGRE